MTKSDVVAIYLSLMLAITQWFWVRAEKRAAYLEGRTSVFTEFVPDGSEGACYAEDGCGKPQPPMKSKRGTK